MSELPPASYKCHCGHVFSFPPGLIGGPLICRCGREYHPPRVHLPTLIARIDRLEEEIRAMRSQLDGGIVLPGWRCPSCQAFNGDEKERLLRCRACNAPRPRDH